VSTPRSATSPLGSLTATVIALSALCGCAEKAGDTGSDAGSRTDPVGYNGPPVSFDEAMTEVLIPSCGFDSCHGSGAGYLRIFDGQTEAEWLDKKSTVLITRSLIEPGSSGTSYLIKKMEGSSDIEGTVMPPSGSIDPYRIGMVRSWIDNIDVAK